MGRRQAPASARMADRPRKGPVLSGLMCLSLMALGSPISKYPGRMLRPRVLKNFNNSEPAHVTSMVAASEERDHTNRISSLYLFIDLISTVVYNFRAASSHWVARHITLFLVSYRALTEYSILLQLFLQIVISIGLVLTCT